MRCFIYCIVDSFPSVFTCIYIYIYIYMIYELLKFYQCHNFYVHICMIYELNKFYQSITTCGSIVPMQSISWWCGSFLCLSEFLRSVSPVQGANEGTEIITSVTFTMHFLVGLSLRASKNSSLQPVMLALTVTVTKYNLVWVMNCVKLSHHWMVHSCSVVNLVLDAFDYGAVFRVGNIWMSVCLYSQMLSMWLCRWCTAVCVTSRAVSSSGFEVPHPLHHY